MTKAFPDKNVADLDKTIGTARADEEPAVRKFRTTVQPGQSIYDIRHRLGSVDVVVQTRINGRIREGGISIVDANCVRLTFGGTLNETLDVVIIG